MNPFKSMVLASLIAAVIGTFPISNANAQAFVDDDGDGVNDHLENPRCVDKADAESRGFMVGADGCAVDFITCYVKRTGKSVAPTSCGTPPPDWNESRYDAFLDSLRVVYETDGTPHHLAHNHAPVWSGGPSGSRTCSSGMFLHVGSTAVDGRGRTVKTELPIQTPPFCHSTIIRASGRSGGGTDSTARKRAKDADDKATAAQEDLATFKAMIEDPITGLGAAHSAAARAQSAADDAQARGDAAYDKAIKAGRTAGEALDLAQNAFDLAQQGKETADIAWREIFVPKTVECNAPVSRLDVVECIARQARANSANRDFIVEVGYAGNGLSVLHDEWERPALHGPLLRVGYRRTFKNWTFIARFQGTPINIEASGFSVGGHVGGAVRLGPLPLFLGGTLGGSGWSAGVYTPGSQGYSDVAGGGIDLDAVFFADVPDTPVTLSVNVGPRFHVVKATAEGDTLFVDFAAGVALQLRL